MKLALVHRAKPKDPWEVGAILDRIADALLGLGYNVVRWRSAYGEPFPKERFDASVVWGGFQNWYPPIKRKLIADGTDMLYADVDHFGWYRYAKDAEGLTFQLQRSREPDLADAGGIGGDAAWNTPDLLGPFRPTQPLHLPDRDPPYLLVALSDDGGMRSIPRLSPYFSSGLEFVKFLLNGSHLPLLLRFHPDYPEPKGVRELAAKGGVRIDDSPDIETALDQCLAVAVIDSHVGVRAVRRSMPLLVYGNTVTRHEGVAYCLDHELRKTMDATKDLLWWRRPLDTRRQVELLAALRKHTWTMERNGVRDRLAGLLEER